MSRYQHCSTAAKGPRSQAHLNRGTGPSDGRLQNASHCERKRSRVIGKNNSDSVLDLFL